MNLKKALLSSLLLLFSSVAFAQPNTAFELAAIKTAKHIKIDGLLNDEAWKDAAMIKILRNSAGTPALKNVLPTVPSVT